MKQKRLLAMTDGGSDCFVDMNQKCLLATTGWRSDCFSREKTEALLRYDGIGKALKARLFQSHKVLLRNDGEKSHCEAMPLPFMAVAIAFMIF